MSDQVGNQNVCFLRTRLKLQFHYAPNFEKVGDILVSACPCVCVCVCMGHRDIVLKLHVWIPHGKIAEAYFWFSLNYLPLLNYGPLTNKGMKFCKCRISKSILARNLKLVSADRRSWVVIRALSIFFFCFFFFFFSFLNT